MKIHKKIMSFFLALSIIFSSAFPVFAVDNEFNSSTFARGGGGSFNTFRNYYTKDAGYGYVDFKQLNSGDTTNTPIIDSNNDSAFVYDFGFDICVHRPVISITIPDIQLDIGDFDFCLTVDNDGTLQDYYVKDNITNVQYYTLVGDTYETVQLYYELPDGRNSYDLTADDIYGTVFSYNSVNYGVAVEDERMLGLWHFDGNLNNEVANSEYQLSSKDSIEFVNAKFEGGVHSLVNNNELILSTDFADSTVEFLLMPLQNHPHNAFNIFIYSPPFLMSPANTNYKFINGVNLQSNGVYSLAVYFDKDLNPKTFYLNGTAYDYNYGVNTDGVLCSTYYVSGDLTGIYKYNSSNVILTCIDLFKTYSADMFGPITDYSLFSSKYSTEFVFDELRISRGDIYKSSNYIPSVQPFDVSTVLVLPDTALQNTLAVKSAIEIANVRYNGVRPSYPNTGDLYIYDDDETVSMQQFQSNGWYTVEGLIYNGSDWVEVTSENLSSITVDEDDYPVVTPSPTPPPDNPSDDDNTDEDNKDDEDETTGILSSIMEKIIGFFTGLLDILFGGILDLITVITDNLTGIIDGFTGITGLIGALFGFLPEQMISVLTSGLAVIIIVVIIKIFI